MKLSSTKILSRQVLLLFIAFTIILTISALFIYTAITHKLAHISKLVRNIDIERTQSKYALLLRSEMGNNSHLSFLTIVPKERTVFKAKLSDISPKINAPVGQRPEPSQPTASQSRKAWLSYNKRVQLSGKLPDFNPRFNLLLTRQGNQGMSKMQAIPEMERIINEVKIIDNSKETEFKNLIFKSHQETTTLLKEFFLMTFFLLLAFAILLIVYVVRINKHEVLLQKENGSSATLAQKKMDLMLHMSHEIRNLLNAIRGFLYIFNKTAQSPQQTKMLTSIRLSSDMLLQTLNDTLDAAKIESNEFKIHNDPFSPDFVLNEVVESLKFSAAQKNLSIDYQFVNDKEAIISGDSFRLQQIMVNLLNNAIKYTNQGRIIINARLESINEENGLQVEVIDTGEGISQEQQVGLFSKYYQTNSAKGKNGTGLGLYICKQLVQLQKGQISVKSIDGAGSTFSFYIPCQNNTNYHDAVVERPNDNPLIVFLNKLKIVTIDNLQWKFGFKL